MGWIFSVTRQEMGGVLGNSAWFCWLKLVNLLLTLKSDNVPYVALGLFVYRQYQDLVLWDMTLAVLFFIECFCFLTKFKTIFSLNQYVLMNVHVFMPSWFCILLLNFNFEVAWKRVSMMISFYLVLCQSTCSWISLFLIVLSI